MLSVGCGFPAARASEGQTFGGPIGGTDIRNAYIPPLPGFYGGFVGAAALADQAYGDNGEQNKAVHVNVPLGLLAGGITYVYPFKLAGGTISSTLEDHFLYGRIVIAGKGQYFNGVGDLYAELLGWSRHIGPQVAHATLPSFVTGSMQKDFSSYTALPSDTLAQSSAANGKDRDHVCIKNDGCRSRSGVAQPRNG